MVSLVLCEVLLRVFKNTIEDIGSDQQSFKKYSNFKNLVIYD